MKTQWKAIGGYILEYTRTIFDVIGKTEKGGARPEEVMRAKFYRSTGCMGILFLVIGAVLGITSASWQMPVLSFFIFACSIVVIYKTEYEFQNEKLFFFYFICDGAQIETGKFNKKSVRFRFVNKKEGEDDLLLFLTRKKETDFDIGGKYFICFNEQCLEKGLCDETMALMPLEIMG